MTAEEALALVEQAIYRSDRAHRSLNSLQRTVFRCAWEACSYSEIARQSGYELTYVKQTGSQLWRLLSQALAEKVTKHNVRLVLQKNLPAAAAAPAGPLPTGPIVDWGDAVDVSHFYGREAELAQLGHWVTRDRCRLIWAKPRLNSGATLTALPHSGSSSSLTMRATP